MAKKFAILLALFPLAACDQYGSYGIDSYGIEGPAKSAMVGGLLGGATNYIVGGNVGQGAALGAISAAGAQFLTQ